MTSADDVRRVALALPRAYERHVGGRCMPAPAAAAWSAMDSGELGELRPLLHPYVRWSDGPVSMRGRTRVLAHLDSHPTPRPPMQVEVRDGQIYSRARH